MMDYIKHIQLIDRIYVIDGTPYTTVTTGDELIDRIYVMYVGDLVPLVLRYQADRQNLCNVPSV